MKDKIQKRFEQEIQTLDRELKLELPKEIQRARELEIFEKMLSIRPPKSGSDLLRRV